MSSKTNDFVSIITSDLINLFLSFLLKPLYKITTESQEIRNLNMCNQRIHETIRTRSVHLDLINFKTLHRFNDRELGRIRRIQVEICVDMINDPLYNKTKKMNNICEMVYNSQYALIPGQLPSTLTHLSFGTYFDKPIRMNELPETLTSLSFGWYFNQRLYPGNLPQTLKYLEFGVCFNY